MSLHEYIDIPLEGSVSSARISSPHTSTPATPRHPPLVAARLFKEWLEASAGARMNEAMRISRESERAKGKRKVAPRCADGSGVFDPGMQTARVEFRIASGGIGPD